MRQAFLLGLFVLGIVLCLELAASRVPARAHPVAGADGGLSILVTAKGTLLPRARLAGGDEDLDAVLVVGDAILASGDVAPGLRVARVHPDLPLACVRRDVASSPAEVEALAATAEESPPGTVLVLGNRGRLAPADEAEAERLAAVLRSLGARAEPARLEPVSWALVTLRRPGGWLPLAESVAQDTGVSLAYTLGRDPLVHRTPGELLEARLEGLGRVRLDLELASAEPLTTTVVASDVERVGPVVLPALRFVPGADAGRPRALAWEGVRLAREPRFRGAIGLREESRAGTDGAWFVLSVDGQEVHREGWVPRADGLGIFRPFEVDLGPWAGRTVRIELRVEPGGNGTGDDALFGLPVLEMRGAP